MNHKEWATHRLSFLATTCAALMMVFCGQIFAQAGIDVGSVTGTVKDPAGALVQKAQCTLTNTDTGTSQKTISTSAGAYVFSIGPRGDLFAQGRGERDSRIPWSTASWFTSVTPLRKISSLQVGAASRSRSPSPQRLRCCRRRTPPWARTIDTTAATELPLFGGSAGRSFMSLITIAARRPVHGQQLEHRNVLVHGNKQRRGRHACKRRR